jgi:hypothetical protein
MKDDDSKVVDFPGAAPSRQMSDEEAQAKALELRPKGLSAAERKIWAEDIPDLIKLGRVKRHHRQFFRQYVIVVARIDRLNRFLSKEGWTYTTEGRNGIQNRARPEAAQLNDDWRKLNSMINQVGGSPATDQRFNNLQAELPFEDPYGL